MHSEAERKLKAEKRIPCLTCGMPIPEPGEYPVREALLCDGCYEKEGEA
jgi:formylmethanofuran dehydrogenase subunit E